MFFLSFFLSSATVRTGRESKLDGFSWAIVSFAAVSTPEELNCAPPNQYCIIILAVAFVAAADEHSVLYIVDLTLGYARQCASQNACRYADRRTFQMGGLRAWNDAIKPRKHTDGLRA